MKVFTAQQMRAFDKEAVEKYNIPSIVLMENAALRVVEFLEAKFAPLREKKIVILCGKGNNGGDGLAIARHLLSSGAEIFLAHASIDAYQGDAGTNMKAMQRRSPSCGYERSINWENHYFDWSRLENEGEDPDPDGWLLQELIENCSRCEILVDAMIGTGFEGELRPYLDQIITAMTLASTVVSVDVLSGSNTQTGTIAHPQFPPRWQKSNFTVTFAAPKRGFFLGETQSHSGEIWVGDIGTRPIQMEETETGCETLDLKTAQRLLPRRSIDAHKGDAGRALIIGGSFGMSGAVALASRAALASGAGLCIAAMPEKILPSFAVSILEATSHPLSCDENGKLLESAADELPKLWEGVQVVALGPGISRSEEAQKFVQRVVRECPVPLVIDADALHALPSMPDDVKNRESDTILTPHPGEMGTLMGLSAKEINESRYEVATQCAKKYGAMVVLKGAHSLVATPEGKIFVNLTGNPGMATGGSGDVLTGTIAGLLAQLENAEDAAKLGVYLHGFAGDLAFEEKGNGLVAGDIAANLPRALVEIPKRKVERINGRLRKLE